MTRLVALVLLAVLIYLVVSAVLRRISAAARAGSRGPGPYRRSAGSRSAADGPSRGEALVRCAACGVRLPESRALAAGRAAGGGAEPLFCSPDCRRRGAARPDEAGS